MSYPNPSTNQQHGFSLIEVLIALVIVSIALLALIEGMSGIIFTQTQLRLQAQAQQVAWQQWQALRAGTPGANQDKTVSHAGQSWLVKTTFSDSGTPNTTQVSIRVQPADPPSSKTLLLSVLVVSP